MPSLELELTMINLHTKYEVTSFIHSKDKTGTSKFKKVTWQWPLPFQGSFVMYSIGLAMVNICTKSEISISTCHEERKVYKMVALLLVSKNLGFFA